MEKEDLDRAFRRDVVITFSTVGEFHSFLREMASFGGKYLNGEPIRYREELLNSTQKSYNRIAVSRDYTLSFVSGICYHYGAFPTIPYTKFKTDRGTVDYSDT